MYRGHLTLYRGHCTFAHNAHNEQEVSMTPDDRPTGDWITVTAAADLLDCDPMTVRRWIQKGLLAGWQPAPNHRWSVRRDSIHPLLRPEAI
jgi:excisionase family DNA binding protein